MAFDAKKLRNWKKYGGHVHYESRRFAVVEHHDGRMWIANRSDGSVHRELKGEDREIPPQVLLEGTGQPVEECTFGREGK